VSSRPPSRRLLRWAAYAAGAYLAACAVSWKAAPAAARWAFGKVPQYAPGFSLAAEEIRFNPFALRADLSGLALKQEKLGELFSCRLLSVALKPTAILRAAFGLRELRLEQPRLTVVIEKDGSTVLNYLPKSAPKEASAEPPFIPRAVIQTLAVSEGALHFESRLPNAPQTLEAAPIAFRLDNLSTIPKQGGKASLEARTDKEERFSWEGGLTVRPARLWGRVSAENLALDRSSELPGIPVEISEGRFDAATDYELALDTRAVSLSLTNAGFAVRGLLWRLKAGSEKSFRGPFNLRVGPAELFAVAKAPGTEQTRLTVDLNAVVESTGAISLRTFITPKPLGGGAELEIKSLPLSIFSPLGPPPTKAVLEDGRLDLRLKAAVPLPEADLDLSLAVSNLSVLDEETRRPLVRVGRFSVDSARLQTKTDRVDVAAIRVDKPYLRVARFKNGKTNVESALGISLSTGQVPPPSPAPAPAAASGQKPWKVRLARLSVTGGRVLAEDSAVPQPFSLTVSDAKAELSNLANDSRSTAAFSAAARVAGAPVSMTGTVRASTSAAWVAAKLKGDVIQLPVFSPYSGQMVGYKIEKGGLTFDFNHALEGRRIVTKNRVVIDQMELGEKVESPDAIQAPVKLGLAILKDRRGVIDLDVPIDGSLDDPEFHLGKVIVKTLVNVVVKAALSPFSVLGGLFGSDKDLGKVAFAPGSADLTEELGAQLDKVAKALDDRPRLFIGVRGGAGRGDALAAGDRILLVKLRGKDAGPEPLTPKEEEKVLSLYRKTFDAKADQVPSVAQARAKLAESWRAPDAELRTLALARTAAIKQALLAKGVAESRFFDLEPASGFDSDEDACKLELDAR
jgi:hypothetical protein